MALQELHFSFPGGDKAFPADWSHTGVVGSGDMEVLISKRDLGGNIEFKIITPVTGFDDVWKTVMQRFAAESGLCNVFIEINDNNATPFTVVTRLRQAVLEAGGETDA